MTSALETRKGVVNDKPFWRVENKRKSDDSRLCEPFELWDYGLTSLDRCPQDISITTCLCSMDTKHLCFSTLAQRLTSTG